MPAAITPSPLLWQVTPPSPIPGGKRRRSTGAEPWRSQSFASETPKDAKRRATRYEKFTTRMVLLSSVLTLGVTAGLHVFNYGLETKTSSTSGTHSNFYKEDE
ncbi:hypothetical protein [Leucobacter sp. M11]|uniref:hypothetical protein n=1 Tax=Leucobacter sp. M11 TaxID=2993565 RepID=UPI002D7F3F52|nr:hypothetical protein [Leucobacter sp. M11]MEB4613645.1 hypothetical protein [Leucobacter sp. M11]